MVYHSLSTPFIGIVLLLFLEFLEIRKKVVKPIKWMAVIGGVSCGIGATFWAYTNLFILHHLFVAGLGVLFLCAILLCYGLIPGEEVKTSDYYNDIPKIKNFNLIHLNALIVILGMIVFTIFGALAALIMLTEDPPVHFFLLEEVYLNRTSPKEIYQELASFHGRLTTALFLTGILILLFRYTKVKGKAAKWGLWMLLAGTIAMTAGYFLMIFMGKAANAILMPARGLILITGAIIAIYAWREIAKEELGKDFTGASRGNKIKASLKNPLRIGMYLPFILAGLVVVIPGLFIVADLDNYRDISNRLVERNFATGHPHSLITLAAITVFCLLVNDLLPKNIWRKIIGWTLIASQLITFPTAALYYFRDPTNYTLGTAYKHIILSGLFLLLIDILIYVVLLVRQTIIKREWVKENIKPFIKES